jgi:apolipoprotein N-acyltransferase
MSFASPEPFKPVRTVTAAAFALIAAEAYFFAFSTRLGSAAILIALPCLFYFARTRSARYAFYGGMMAGMAIYVPHLAFFWNIFHYAAIPLWLVAGLPIAVFTLLLNGAHRRLGLATTMLLTPLLWTGIEYFRSECYYLRFAWLLPGQAVAFSPAVRQAWIGVYGLGFLYALFAALLIGPGRSHRAIGLAGLLVAAGSMYYPRYNGSKSDTPLHVAGVQLESPDARAAARALEELAVGHPEAQILVLSEYSFFGPVPPEVRKVIRKHRRYLIAGGVRQLSDDQRYNTAYVIDPDGRDIFEQVKSVPVQLMNDGLPAERRRVWESPWGKIGIAVCYDLSYVRVMDDFVRQGAQGLIIPTMDVRDWGEYERRMLHGRVAPIRSAEYGIPTFGVWSSGVSQLTDAGGQVIATAGYPGQGEMIAGPFDLSRVGRVPPDRMLADFAMMITGAFVLMLAIESIARRATPRRRAIEE